MRRQLTLITLIYVKKGHEWPSKGFQEVRTGHGSVLTEYEPVGPHSGGPIHEGVCSESGFFVSQHCVKKLNNFFCGMSAAGQEHMYKCRLVHESRMIEIRICGISLKIDILLHNWTP